MRQRTCSTLIAPKVRSAQSRSSRARPALMWTRIRASPLGITGEENPTTETPSPRGRSHPVSQGGVANHEGECRLLTGRDGEAVAGDAFAEVHRVVP